MRLFLTSLVCLCLSISTSFNALADNWPQFRGPARDGKSGETGLWAKLGEQGPKLAWMVSGVGRGYASLAVVDGRIYTTGNTGKGQAVFALNATTGEELWEKLITETDPKHSYDGSRTTPAVDGERLYVVSSDGRIVCLKTSDGSKLWEQSFKQWNGRMMSGWGFSESPLVDGDWVLCTPGGNDAMMVALDKLTGNEVWRSALPSFGQEAGVNEKQLRDGAGYASIMVSQGGGVKQYIQLVGRGVIGVRASDGKLLWRYSYVANATANIPTVLIDGDLVFCSTGYGTGSGLLKLLPAQNNEVQMVEVYSLKANELQNKHGGMILHDGHVYCGHGNGSGLPICVNLADGKVAWGPQRGSGNGEASVIYADGHILYRFQDGMLALVKAHPSEYAVVTSFKPAYQEGKSWSYPVIAGGKLYLREQDRLMCYELRD